MIRPPLATPNRSIQAKKRGMDRQNAAIIGRRVARATVATRVVEAVEAPVRYTRSGRASRRSIRWEAAIGQ